MTDDEIEATVGEPLSVDLDIWTEEVMRIVRRHSLPSLIEAGQLDAFDALLIAPFIVAARRRKTDT